MKNLFLSLVRALNGDPDHWAWRWRAADAAHRTGAAGRDFRPLPGLPAAAAAAPREPVPDWPPPRHLLSRLAWRLLRWVMAVLSMPARSSKDRSEEVQVKRMAQRVLYEAQKVIDRSEAVQYLPPRFTLLIKPPARRKRKELRLPPIPRPTSETDIRVLFAKSGEDLAVVGRPGLGKSTQLARLARSLAQDAIDDPSRPVPVLLDLTTYRGQRLEDWLVTAIGTAHSRVPAALVRTWLDKVRLLPILDGLDRVPAEHRPRCVSELQRFRGACKGLAFGCRTDDADLLDLARSIDATLTVEITPPTGNDVQEYLNARIDALRDVHAALSRNEDLWPLLQSPLMLSVITYTYRDRPATELHDTTLTPDERRDRIFDAYICRMLDDTRRRRDDTPEQILTWLTWLARTLSDRNERVLYLDRLDLTWLTPRQRLLPRVIPNTVQTIFGLALALLWLTVLVRAGAVRTSLADATAFAAAMAIVTATQAVTYEKHTDEKDQMLRRIPAVARNMPFIVASAAALMYFRVDYGAPGIIVTGLAFLWIQLTMIEAAFGDAFSPVEQLRWTWRAREYRLYSPRKNFLARNALSCGMSAVMLALLGHVLHLLAPRSSWITAVAVSVLMLLWVAGSLFQPSLEERRPRPNEGIRRTVRFCIAQGTLNFLAVAAVLLALLTVGPGTRSVPAGLVALLPAALYALCRAFRFGGLAILRHWTIRAVLAASGTTPYRYRQFLYDAEQSILLHRTTSGFSFPHDLLQAHMATDPRTLLPRVTPGPSAHPADTAPPMTVALNA